MDVERVLRPLVRRIDDRHDPSLVGDPRPRGAPGDCPDHIRPAWALDAADRKARQGEPAHEVGKQPHISMSRIATDAAASAHASRRVRAGGARGRAPRGARHVEQ
jgi:hypothetical protein